jgi:hypothetical protein
MVAIINIFIFTDSDHKNKEFRKEYLFLLFLHLWYLQTLLKEFSTCCFRFKKNKEFYRQKIWNKKARTKKCLRQMEHIRGHLWHRYAIAVNQVDRIRVFFLQNKFGPFLAQGIYIYVGHYFSWNSVGPTPLICPSA